MRRLRHAEVQAVMVLIAAFLLAINPAVPGWVQFTAGVCAGVSVSRMLRFHRSRRITLPRDAHRRRRP